MDTIIYTCITGGYDKLNEIETSHKAICFTDQSIESDTWEIVKINFEPKIFRKIKICPHLYLPNHIRNIWIDGNLIATDIDQIIFEKTGFWAMAHPDRDCVYQEALRCMEIGKDSEDVLLRQINKYYANDYPFHNGMITSSFLIRDNTKENQKFGDLWWKEVYRYSVRDQVSFNYVAWKMGLQYKTIPFLSGLTRVKHTINNPTMNC